MKHRVAALAAIAMLLVIAVHACAYGALPKGREDLSEPQAELVLRYCLAAAPGVCREERPLLGAVPQSTCLRVWQFIAVDWLADHPKWSFAGARCEEGVPRERGL